MDGEDRPDNGSIDFQHDDEDNTGLKVDAGTYVPAATLGTIVLPKGTPSAKAAFIEAQANYAQRLPDVNNVTIGNNGGGSLGMKTKEQRQQESEDAALDYITFAVEEAERERERAEWARTPSTVGGVTMTGAEWAELSQRLRSDEDLHRRIIEAFRARGMSEAEAEARYKRVGDVADAASTPPSQRTEKQREDIRQADADPTFQGDANFMRNNMNEHAPSNASALNGSFTHAAIGTDPTPTANAIPATPGPVVTRPSIFVDGPGM